MTILNLLFLIPLFLIGSICSWTDVKYGKIKNKWLGLGFLWVVILYLSLALFNYFYLHQPVNNQFLVGMIVNGLVALVLGYMLWSLKLLAAGDAKLFTLYAFLIPPEFYSKSYLFGFPSFILLINIFAPLLLFLASKALAFNVRKIRNGIREKKKISVKEKLKNLPSQLPKVLWNLAGFIVILVAIQLILKELNLFSGGGEGGSNYSAYLFVLLFFAYRFVFRFIFKNKILSTSAILAGVGTVIYLVFSGQTEFLFNMVKIAIVVIIFMSIFQKLMGSYVEQKEVRKIGPEDIKTGSFIAFQSLDYDLRVELGKIDQDGLTQKQAEALRDFLARNPDKEIKAYKTFALAPFMLLGALISICTSDSFILLFAKVFNLLF